MKSGIYTYKKIIIESTESLCMLYVMYKRKKSNPYKKVGVSDYGSYWAWILSKDVVLAVQY